MPIYRYLCKCGKVRDEFRKIADRDNSPICHGPMERRIVPTMVQVFTPYQAVAFDEDGKRPFIRSSREHRDFLRRNNFEEIGNDSSMAPKPPRELETEATTYDLTEEDFQ